MYANNQSSNYSEPYLMQCLKIKQTVRVSLLMSLKIKMIVPAHNDDLMALARERVDAA